jgi:hypothetical protein
MGAGLKSRNGTFVNNDELPKGQAYLVDSDATIRFGPHCRSSSRSSAADSVNPDALAGLPLRIQTRMTTPAFMVIAHRGASSYAPENTLAAL